MEKNQVQNDKLYKEVELVAQLDKIKAEIYAQMPGKDIDYYILNASDINKGSRVDGNNIDILMKTYSSQFLSDISVACEKCGYEIFCARERIALYIDNNENCFFIFYAVRIYIKDPNIQQETLTILPMGLQSCTNYIHSTIKQVVSKLDVATKEALENAINKMNNQSKIMRGFVTSIINQFCDNTCGAISINTVLYWVINYKLKRVFHNHYTNCRLFL